MKDTIKATDWHKRYSKKLQFHRAMAMARNEGIKQIERKDIDLSEVSDHNDTDSLKTDSSFVEAKEEVPETNIEDLVAPNVKVDTK